MPSKAAQKTASSVSHETWLSRLDALIATVKAWGEELDWSARVADKRMRDSEVGEYRAPILLLQKNAVRMILEPIARRAEGTEGVIDLYLMPGYEDVANLFYYGGRWHLRYNFAQAPDAGIAKREQAYPLTKSILRRTLDRMMANVG